MIVSDIRLQSGPDYHEITARIQPDAPGAGVHMVYFRTPAELLPPPVTGDPFVAGFLTACMFDDEPLRIEGPVSREIMSSLHVFQRTYAGWFPDTLREIEVEAAEIYDRCEGLAPDRGTAACFSAGVDSCDTLLTRDSELTHLLHVRRFNDFSRDDRLWNPILEHCRAAAGAFSKTLIVADTNLRRFVDKNKPMWGRQCRRLNYWVKIGHGSFLAAVALCLRATLRRLIIPSTHVVADLHPLGSHPDTDRLWSTADLSIEHDSCESTRLEKVIRIAQSDALLQRLSVCFSPTPHGANCCRCEKCMRTMLQLRLAGRLDRATTFPLPLDLRRVRAIGRSNPWRMVYYRQILSLAEEKRDKEVIESVRTVLDRRYLPQRIYARTIGRLLSSVEKRRNGRATR